MTRSAGTRTSTLTSTDNCLGDGGRLWFITGLAVTRWLGIISRVPLSSVRKVERQVMPETRP